MQIKKIIFFMYFMVKFKGEQYNVRTDKINTKQWRNHICGNV